MTSTTAMDSITARTPAMTLLGTDTADPDDTTLEWRVALDEDTFGLETGEWFADGERAAAAAAATGSSESSVAEQDRSQTTYIRVVLAAGAVAAMTMLAAMASLAG